MNKTISIPVDDFMAEAFSLAVEQNQSFQFESKGRVFFLKKEVSDTALNTNAFVFSLRVSDAHNKRG